MGGFVKIFRASAVLALLALTSSAEADTLTTGVLSPDTVRALCAREGARFRDFGSDGYGCHTATLTITCRATLDCVTRVKDLNPYLGGGTNVYLRRHGETRFESLDDE
jgi:hypothetical protein